jgi:peptidoglycan/xylan/chitin deacetylase (PgdA/CDA1 family)
MASKRELAATMLNKSGARALLGRAVKWSGVMTLNYHRIGDGSASPFDRGLWSATTEDFDAQVQFVKKQFDVISPADLPEARRQASGRFLIITFDDGYADNFHAAFPVLKAHGVPATFFIATGFIDKPSLPWWDEIAWMVRRSTRGQIAIKPWSDDLIIPGEGDREQSIRKLLRIFKAMPSADTGHYLEALAQATGTGRFHADSAGDLWMTWDMLRQMNAAGMTIGGHTVHHPILARMPEEQQYQEISGCQKRIETELSRPMTCLSYPVGNTTAFNQATRNCLKKCGIQHAFSYYGGIQTFDSWDDHDIRRLPVDNDLSFDHFRAMVMLPQVFGRAETAP